MWIGISSWLQLATSIWRSLQTLSGMLISPGRLKCAGVTGTDKRFSELSMNLLYTRRLHQLPAIRATCWKMLVPGNFKTGGRSSRVWPTDDDESGNLTYQTAKDRRFRMHALHFYKIWYASIMANNIWEVRKVRGCSHLFHDEGGIKSGFYTKNVY